MTGKLGLTFVDASGESSRIEVNTATATAVNLDDIQEQADPATSGGLTAAIKALSLCALIAYEVIASKNKPAYTDPTNMFAQRELGLMVSYRDSVTGKMYRITIPGPNWTAIGVAGTDKVNPAASAWTGFVTAFEAAALSPDGNAVTVTGGRLVGRAR
jgi:hypothetical protein